MSRYFSVCFLCTVGWFHAAEGALYTVPRAGVGVEGNSFSFVPFGSNVTSARFQQVFAASQFTIFDQGVSIEGILFRADSQYGSSYATTLRDIQVNLSTTLRAPDGLSAIFSENLGSDDSIVFDRGPVTVSSDCCGPPPQLFTMVMLFDRPFFFDPTAGNLLLDIRNFDGFSSPIGLGALDAVLTPGDSISSIWASDPTASTADQISSLGLVAGLAVTAVPELSSVALLLAGLVFFGAHSRQRKRQACYRTH
jgi:hypothetical protein